MLNENKITNAETLIDGIGGKNITVKRVKKDMGLIERTEKDHEKIILTEDNRQVLFG